MIYDLEQTLTELHGLFHGDRDGMIRRCTEILANDPTFIPAVMMMALAAYAAGDEGLAINFLEKAHEAEPERKEYVDLLAAILPRAGRVSDSLYYGKLAVALDPDPVLAPFVPTELSSYHDALSHVRASPHAMVAEMALRAGQFKDALLQSDEELRINPNSVGTMILSARALLGLGRPNAAVNTLRAAVHADLSGWLHAWLGQALLDCGDHSGAVPHLRLAVSLEPKDVALASLVAGLTEWLDDANWVATADLRDKLRERIRSGRGTKTPETKPVTKMIGLLSDQCYTTASTGFLLPVIKAMENTVLYRLNQRHDTDTKGFHHAALRVRECAEVDVFTLGRTYLGDLISVLMDLGIPTQESKYVYFNGKGGPTVVQWVTNPLADRLPTAEIVVADPETIDVDERTFGPDAVVSLDHLVAYGFPEIPAQDEMVGPLPRSRKGNVTFGVYGDFRRMTPHCIALWAQCVLAVPGSTLLIGGRNIWEDGLMQVMHDRFAEYGIGPRVSIHTSADEMESPLAFLAEVDVVLDSVPVSAGSETALSLWMGTPVITLKGDRRAGRFGASVLRAAGFPEWIATSEAEFVAKAKDLAVSADLADMRESLRLRVLASPLADPAGLAKALSEAVLSKVTNGMLGR